MDAVAGLLMLVDFKAFANDVIVMKTHHIKQGFYWPQLLEVTVNECTRSTLALAALNDRVNFHSLPSRS